MSDYITQDTDSHQVTTLRPAPPVAVDSGRYITGPAFLRRFTAPQRIAIRALAATNPGVDDFLRLLDATIAQGGGVNLDDPDTVAGVAAVASLLPAQNIDPAVILA